MKLGVFDFPSKRAVAGAVFACLTLAVCGIWYSVGPGILFALAFLAAGSLRFPKGRPAMAFGVSALFGLGCMAVFCVMPSVLMGSAGGFLALGKFRMVMNFVCTAAVCGLILAVLGGIKSSIAVSGFALMALATVNFFVFQFRGHELKPADFLYVKTAVNVMGQYRFQIPAAMAYGWMFWLWSVFALGTLPPVSKPGPWLTRLGALAASLLCLLTLWYGGRDIKGHLWAEEGTLYNGYYLNFFVELRDSVPVEPEGYSPENIAQLEQDYSGATAPAEKRPNILVIMSESYADLGVLGSEPQTDRPVTPFLDSLRENTVRGWALTSIFGGTTANSEFEFLTGGSMAFMPPGTVPYVQHIRRDCFSLGSVLKSYGYSAGATHPYLASGYDREKIYPRLGFTDITFDEAYPHAEKVRQFVSDRAVYDFLLDRIGENPEPTFLFAITMQNHGGYSFPDFEDTLSLEGNYPQAQQYLSLLQETDRATEEFLKKLEQSEEDTVVLFFGDHLPDLEWEFYQELHGGPLDTLEDQMLRHSVPFFIWANFDIPEEEGIRTSLNYLAPRLLSAAGLPLPPYYQFLADVESHIPEINALGYYDPSRQAYLPIAEASGEAAQWLDRYRQVQYNGLFDGEHPSPLFFGQYLKK